MFSKKFICATKEYTTFEKAVPAPYLRKTISLNSDVKSAEITICGLGFYELYINGTNVTKGFIAPYVSNPDDFLYYDKYDIKKYLTEGENVIGIILGNGQLNNPGGTVWDFQLATFRSSPKVALHCEIASNDGALLSFEADESFLCHPSPIIFDDFRGGEFYDANLEIPGWNLKGLDTSDWTNALPAETPRGEASFCACEPIKILEELTAISVRPAKIGPDPAFRPNLPVIEVDGVEAEKSGFLYDFGKNVSGLPKLRIKASKGQKIVIQVGENLNSLGELDLRNMNFLPYKYNQRDLYIAKGEGIEEYMPRFTYQGFQYVLVLGITPEQATDDLIKYEVMGTAFDAAGKFETSDKIINRIQEITLNSDIANFFYIPLDCPHREKNGWTGDAALSAEQFLTNFKCENALKEWLRNIQKAQNDDGVLPGIVPTSGWGFTRYNGPVWDNVLFEIPYCLWKMRGDTDVIRDCAHSMIRYLNYMHSKRDQRGLYHFGLGDWCHVGRPSHFPKAPLEVTDTLTCLHICQNAAKMFSAVGMFAEAQYACTIGNEIRMAARKYLIMSDGITVLGRCQTSQALGIFYNLFDPGEVSEAFGVLLELIEESGHKMDVGVLGARVLFRVLADMGEIDLAYELITTKEYPSFGWWVDVGATSLWEAFWPQRDEIYPVSKNHHFWGDISAFFYEYIAGIKVNPHETTPDEILISPMIPADMNDAKAHVTVPKGVVSASWYRDGEDIILTVEVPDGTFGSIIPDMLYQFEDGYRVKPLASGTYRLISGDKIDKIFLH